MSVQHAIMPGRADLEENIKNRIVHRTGGRVRGLQVEVTDGRVEVRGKTASFHLKQLAIQGVFDVINSELRTELDIDVQIFVGPLW
ncbi:MAG TPA: hypothetical protein VE988_07230 [Gemmataceae bacterium]|nr:hypothetical protein [Gemmataceae bacterium]